MPRLGPALVTLGVLSACNRGFVLDLRLDEGTTGDLAFAVGHTARVAIGDFAPEFEVRGERRVEGRSASVAGDLVVADTVTSVSMYRKLGDGPVTWSSDDGAPERPFLEAGRWYGAARTVTLRADGTRSVDPAPPEAVAPGDDEADLPAVLAALLHAPDRRIKAGERWWIETGTGDDGTSQYRTWTLTGVDQAGIAVIEETNPTGDPLQGQLPDEAHERRSRLEFDVRRGLPVDYRMRDLRRKLMAVDVEASFDWSG